MYMRISLTLFQVGARLLVGISGMGGKGRHRSITGQFRGRIIPAFESNLIEHIYVGPNLKESTTM